jgi:hypothetical protein
MIYSFRKILFFYLLLENYFNLENFLLINPFQLTRD